MPNRDHDDSYYNRNEGRFESARDERDDYRDQSYRSSRDWDRRDDRNRGYSAGSSYNYNPARDDNDYRGGNRYEDSSRYQGYQGARAWDSDARNRDFSRGSQFGSSQGSYRGDWSRGDYGRDQWSNEYSPQQTLRGGYGASRPSFYNPNYTTQGNFGGTQDWNRDYTRDWDRDYRGDFGRSRNLDQRSEFRGGREDNDWGEQLRHAGQQMIGRVKRAFRGPKGYKRSDDRIREDISDRLAQQDEIDPSEIEVQVQNGDVTLTGSVRTRHEKFRAEEIADDVSGVNDVNNQLRVGSQQQQYGTTTGTSTSTTSTTQQSRNGRA